MTPNPNDPIAAVKPGATLDNLPGASYSSTSKIPIYNPEQNYLTPGRTPSSSAALGFDFAKYKFSGDGTNLITFGQVTASIHQKGHVGNLNMHGPTTREVVQEDGSVQIEEIKRGANMYALG